jgi:hypothetical protein
MIFVLSGFHSGYVDSYFCTFSWRNFTYSITYIITRNYNIHIASHLNIKKFYVPDYLHYLHNIFLLLYQQISMSKNNQTIKSSKKKLIKNERYRKYIMEISKKSSILLLLM